MNDLCGVVDFEQTQFAAAGDVQQDAGRTFDRVLQQRALNGRLRRIDRAGLACRSADPHHRRAGIGHHSPNVGEVEVDQTRDRDQVGDALNALSQNVVGLTEGFKHGRTLLNRCQQTLVGDHDQRVNDFAQASDALVGSAHPLRAFEFKRAGYDADGECADFSFGDLSDHRGSAGSGAAAFASSDEDHVGALERLLDVVA
ncbi:unannotated protein [freshwater metagenome]|uniref:Unannotated protein n=1 Tax=freshwater metagenome TaxID=449393 RepID=A0A6J5ZA68_9ZZZZ